MTRLEIVVDIERDEGQVTGWAGIAISFRALADGEPMAANAEDIACLAGFHASLTGDGRYMLYNCSCGDFGCGGYRDGVDVHYTGANVTLTNADSAQPPVYEFDAGQFRSAVAAAIESGRRQLPGIVAGVQFRCYDDATVFGLDPSVISMSLAQQRAFEPGGLFDRHPELAIEYVDDRHRRTLQLWTDAHREVRSRGLDPTSEPGRIVNELVAKGALELANEDPEHWYRHRADG